MCQRSSMVIPLMRMCGHIRAPPQTRNIRFMGPFDVIRDIDRHFERLEKLCFSPLRVIAPRYMPIEGQKSSKDCPYHVNVDVHGFKPEDIKISLKEGKLKIEAHMDKTAGDGSRFQQSIQHEFTLPSNVDKSSIKSLLHEDGILSIEAQVNGESQAKDIPIEHLQDGESTKSKM